MVQETIPSSSPKAALFYTTVGTEIEARALAQKLVEQKMAACVNILSPLTAYFPWQGSVDWGEEIPLLVKSVAPHFEKTFEGIKAHHPYEIPCIMRFDLDQTHENYVEWMKNWMSTQ